MNRVIRVRVGKKYALYLPKFVVEKLGIKEGDDLVIILKDDSLVLRKTVDFFETSFKVEKKTKLKPEEIEEASVEMQKEVLCV